MLPLAEPFSLDKCEAVMAAFYPEAEMPLTHTFTPGIYARQIYMPAGSLVSTVIHNVEHPFVISMGKVSIYTEGAGVDHLEAPFCGVTLPGTRRLLYVHEDCIFSTFHPNPDNETDPEKIKKRVTMEHVNPYLGLPLEELMPLLRMEESVT